MFWAREALGGVPASWSHPRFAALFDGADGWDPHAELEDAMAADNAEADAAMMAADVAAAGALGAPPGIGFAHPGAALAYWHPFSANCKTESPLARCGRSVRQCGPVQTQASRQNVRRPFGNVSAAWHSGCKVNHAIDAQERQPRHCSRLATRTPLVSGLTADKSLQLLAIAHHRLEGMRPSSRFYSF